jgi:DNA-binding response OmpR family regulator
MMPLVLLVESDADLRSAIASALNRAEYRCDAVASPADAVLKLRDCEYAYVVVDVESVEPLTSLRNALDFQRGKVVFITEDDDPNSLHKPFDNAELLAHLD